MCCEIPLITNVIATNVYHKICFFQYLFQSMIFKKVIIPSKNYFYSIFQNCFNIILSFIDSKGNIFLSVRIIYTIKFINLVIYPFRTRTINFAIWISFSQLINRYKKHRLSALIIKLRSYNKKSFHRVAPFLPCVLVLAAKCKYERSKSH